MYQINSSTVRWHREQKTCIWLGLSCYVLTAWPQTHPLIDHACLMKPFDTKRKQIVTPVLRALALCGLFTHALAIGQTTAPKPARVVTQYALTSAQDYSNPDPQAWHLLGSNDDGHSWTVLDVQTNQGFKTRSQRRVFGVSNQIAYNTYRFQLDNVTDVALAELELMGPVVGAT